MSFLTTRREQDELICSNRNGVDLIAIQLEDNSRWRVLPLWCGTGASDLHTPFKSLDAAEYFALALAKEMDWLRLEAPTLRPHEPNLEKIGWMEPKSKSSKPFWAVY